MDVALRAVSWIWGFYFFGESDACRLRAFRAAFLRALFLHGEFVASHLERGDVNGNHYLCDGVGLVFLGAFFRRTTQGREWLPARQGHRRARRSSIRRQRRRRRLREVHGVSPAGARSVSHVAPAAATGTASGCRPTWMRAARTDAASSSRRTRSRTARCRSSAMPTMAACRSSGAQAINDHRYLLSAGAVLFARGDFKRAARTILGTRRSGCSGRTRADRFDAIAAATAAGRVEGVPRRRLLRAPRRERAHVIVRLRRSRHARPRRARPQRHHQPRGVARTA